MASTHFDGSDRIIFVAIDFGTTFSGVTWAAATRPGIQNAIIQWPDAHSQISTEGMTSEKVPTELVYERNGAGIRWGFQIKEREQRHQWFKLGLDPESVLAESSLARKYPDTRALPPAYAMTPAKMSTDFLRALRKHAYDIISHKLSSAIVETTLFAFIVTVPALWKERAKETTRRCAREAGLGDNVKIISEPEVAAIHALDMMDPHGLEIGQIFIVADCGGGTVDLISYEVVALKPMLKVREATCGTAGILGSSLLNRIFQRHLEDRYKGSRGWDEEVLEEAIDKFEKTTKRNFCGGLVDEYIIPVNGLRDNAAKGVKRGRYRMIGQDLAEVFRPVIEGIIVLVKTQVEFCVIMPKAILLVGGFGANTHLRESLKSAFPKIQVMQPAHGWSSVSRGALSKAISEATPDLCKINISSRIARKYYGFVWNVEFTDEIHDSAKKYWSKCEGRHQINTMNWVVRKGDEVKESEPVVVNVYRTQLCAQRPFQSCTDDFYVFDDGVAPLYNDHNVKYLASLTADLSSIPSTCYKTVTGADGELYYEIHFEIKVTFFSAHTDYSLWHRGERYGSVEAEYAS